ncbi:MAG: site-2 protease family protein [Candidatus Niyogibacteria bacterium]|nr:site-2 protease family protein [Candidatus Niyogibacteria bacterium]
MQAVDFIFSVLILIMSVVVHEVSHGYVAYSLGDPTAKHEGRLTLNPLKHLDPFGSVLLPVITYLLGGFIFGWAKPVPYNPYNLKNQRWGSALVAAAGPGSNIAVALVFGLILRFAFWPASPAFTQALSLIVFINLLLAFFNLIPIPPLDGSKIFFTLIRRRWPEIEYFFEKWGLILLLFFIFFFFRLIFPLVLWAFHFITGLALF